MPGRRKKNHKSFRDLAREGATHFEVSYKNQTDPSPLDGDQSEHGHVPDDVIVSAREKRMEEQIKYGICFDDEYDYMQHLRNIEDIQDSEMKLVSTFKLREPEEEASSSTASAAAAEAPNPAADRELRLLNVAAEPGEDWDPDIVAALDEEFDFDDPDNALDDDFMQIANNDEGPELGKGDDEGEEEKDGEWKDVDEDTESADEGEMETAQSEEKAAALTQWLKKVNLNGQAGQDSDRGSDEASMGDDDDSDDYSDDMTEGDMPRVSMFSASMMPRNENKQFLDQKTQAVLEREYAEDKMGALDGEELGGRVTFNSDLFKQAFKDIEHLNTKVTMKDLFNSEERIKPVVPEKWKYVEEKDYSVEEAFDHTMEPLVVSKKPEFDCESIISTYSTTKNLPSQITIPEEWNTNKKKKKQKKQEQNQQSGELSDTDSESTQHQGLSLKEIEHMVRLERLADAPSTFRPKNETAEERRERKQCIKAHDKERRAEKKLNKQAFQGEEKRLIKVKKAADAQKRVVSFQS